MQVIPMSGGEVVGLGKNEGGRHGGWAEISSKYFLWDVNLLRDGYV